jgi:hypothetical protein
MLHGFLFLGLLWLLVEVGWRAAATAGWLC